MADDKRVVLAYSGGLDTSCILLWLIEEGYKVIGCLVDVGQPAEDAVALKKKAVDSGAEDCLVVDMKSEFVTDMVLPAMRGNMIYESRYLLGTSLARPAIAKALVQVAHQFNCKYLAHGATGKGNDQVRLELHCNYLDPHLEMIAPWRIPKFFQRFEGRSALLEYAAAKGIHIDSNKKSYSVDENLLHVSYESGVLEDPASTPPPDMWQMTVAPEDAPDKAEHIQIDFEKGNPVKVTNLDDGHVETEPLPLFLYLNTVAGRNAVGRVDIVENRFVGMKSRGCYETPGGTLLMAAHIDLEAITLDRQVLRIRDSLKVQFADIIYNGLWYSPEGDYMRMIFDGSQANVKGTVKVKLYKGNVTMAGRSSPNTLYDSKLVSMEEGGDYNPEEAQGFVRINGMRLKFTKRVLEAIDAEAAAGGAAAK